MTLKTATALCLLALAIPAGGEGPQNTPEPVLVSLREPDWSTYLNVYFVAGTDQQIFLALSFRGRTDQQLIRRLRARDRLTWCFFPFCRLDGVVPVTVEAVSLQVDLCELFVAYFDAC